MKTWKITLYLMVLTVLSYLISQFFQQFLIALAFFSPILLYVILEIRYSFAYLPFYILAKIQGKNFKLASDLKEIKQTLLLTDKGRGLEELFSTPAWEPIISLESCNSPIWDEIRANFMTFKEMIPPIGKLSEIASDEASLLISENIFVDSAQISRSTVKIFLKWLLYDNQELYHLINENFCERLYKASLEFRKEIAIKGKGSMEIKKESVSLVVNLIKQSKYANLFDWDKPIFYSVIMQPFVISPMINISDIAVNISKYLCNRKNLEGFEDFIEYCIYVHHPFPYLERFDSKTNTNILIDLTNLKNNSNFDGKLLNFGMGKRSCLGRVFAKEFLNSFFKNLSDYKSFKPCENHLYSGRDNDKVVLNQTIYQIKTIIKVFLHELFRN